MGVRAAITASPGVAINVGNVFKYEIILLYILSFFVIYTSNNNFGKC